MRALPGHAARSPAGHAPVSRSDVSRDQRQRILRAVGELVAKRGYHATTVELIIRRAKVGYATFYKNFESKEDCFLEFFDGAVSLAVRRMSDAFDPEQPWPEQMAAALRAFFELIVERPVLARACMVESLTAGPKSAARYEMALRAMRPFIEPGRRYNPAKAELPETLEDTIAGGVHWIAYQRLIIGDADRLIALLPETLEFLLTPYLGEKDAVQAAGALAAELS